MREIVKKEWRELQNIWKALYDENTSLTPFQDFEFLTFTGKGKPYRKDMLRLMGLKELNLVLYAEGDAVAVAPLLFKKEKGKSTVYFRGHFTTANHLDFIYRPAWTYEDFSFLMDGVRGLLGNVSFFMDRVSGGSVTSGYLKQYLAGARIEEHDCYAIPVPESHEDWLKSLHKHMRKNLIRRDHLIREDHGDVHTTVIRGRTVDKKTARAMMNIYAARFLEKNHFKFGPLTGLVKRGLIVWLMRDKMTKWLNMAENSFHYLLYVGSDIAAIHSGLICRDRRIVFSRLAINTKYAKYGPGGLMLSYMIQYAIDQNTNGGWDIGLLDLSQGGEDGMEYKKSHGGQLHYNYTFIT